MAELQGRQLNVLCKQNRGFEAEGCLCFKVL